MWKLVHELTHKHTLLSDVWQGSVCSPLIVFTQTQITCIGKEASGDYVACVTRNISLAGLNQGSLPGL